MDKFAQIAANGIGGRMELLEEPKPAVYPKIISVLEETSDIPVETTNKMSDKEELKAALDKMREEYMPFLRNLAPDVKNIRQRIDISSFVCDGKEVTIPEYGGPTGKIQKTYITEIMIPFVQKDQGVYIHFEGADYITVFMVNVRCAGEHEGFFSPFEFDITELVHEGSNTVLVELYNDHIYNSSSNADGSASYEGDKLYAATGIGWDDPSQGWHHCPPGMGIYNSVYVEIRKRINIKDIFVRASEYGADAWI